MAQFIERAMEERAETAYTEGIVVRRMALDELGH
jgi:hypothetical protein